MKTQTINSSHSHQSGFTLVEMAIVLLIVVVLLGGLVPTLSGQVEQRHNADTKKQLDEIKEALIGFAIINGRLPCPADPAAAPQTGAETFQVGHSAADGVCSTFYGYVPAATLGLSGTNSSGLVVDAWNNPIRYAVTPWQSGGHYVFTAYDPANSFGISTVGISNLAPTLLVCSSATAAGFSGSSCGTNNSLTSNGVPVVIFSTGQNGGSGGTGADETANLDSNLTFVSHEPYSTPGNVFDDIVTWISPNVLVNRMVAAGKLP